jgi:flagellar biosynthesis protein FlhB
VSDKTEPPTPRRLRRARERGDSGVSAYAGQAVAFVVAVAVAPRVIRSLAALATADLRAAIARAASVHGGVDLGVDAEGLGPRILSLSLPMLVAVGATAVVVQVVQTGGVLATSRIAPQIGRLDPLAGARALVSGPRLFAVARSLAACLLVGWLTIDAVRSHVVDWARVAGRPAWIPVVVSDAAGGLARRAAIVGLLLAVVDVVVTRRAWWQRLRMTRSEARREQRQAEGDPQVKAERKRAHHEMLAQATAASASDATVVVVMDPPQLACALRYDVARGDEVPIVLATGQGDLAARIAKVARDAGVPVVVDAPVARRLVEIEAGDPIAESLYDAVAGILKDLEVSAPIG